MRIIVDNGGYDLRNVGDTALMQVCVKRISDRWPKARLEVFTRDPHRLAIALPDVSPLGSDGKAMFMERWNVFGAWQHFVPDRLKWRFANLEFHARMANPFLAAKWIGWRRARRSPDTKAIHDLMETISRADAVVATGGGYFTDRFAGDARGVIATLRIAQKLGKPTALFGQGLGPLGDWSLRRELRKVLRNADLVALRDDVGGSRLLDELGCPETNVIVTGDDTVEIAHCQREQELGVHIGLNVRKDYYSGLDSFHLSRLRSVLGEIVSDFETSFVPVPTSWHERDLDLDNIRSVVDSLPSALWDLPALDTPNGVIQQIGKCRIAITGSYHGGVFALSQGIPTVGLAKSAYYQLKFRGLADQFGEGCWVVSLDSPEFERNLSEAVRTAWRRAEELRPRLLKAAENQIDRGWAAYRRFFKTVEERRDNSNV